MGIIKNLELNWSDRKLRLISWRNKAKSMQISSFKWSAATGKKYIGFKFIVDLFSDSGHCHWIELTVLDWIVSLRIDTKYGRESIERFKRQSA